MFAGSLENCLVGWESVQRELDAAGRPREGFGADLLTVHERSVDRVVAASEAWERAGGTHLSVVCTGMGFDSTEAHLDFIHAVHDKLH
jgi:hypothetical protein